MSRPLLSLSRQQSVGPSVLRNVRCLGPPALFMRTCARPRGRGGLTSCHVGARTRRRDRAAASRPALLWAAAWRGSAAARLHCARAQSGSRLALASEPEAVLRRGCAHATRNTPRASRPRAGQGDGGDDPLHRGPRRSHKEKGDSVGTQATLAMELEGKGAHARGRDGENARAAMWRMHAPQSLPGAESGHTGGQEGTRAHVHGARHAPVRAVCQQPAPCPRSSPPRQVLLAACLHAPAGAHGLSAARARPLTVQHRAGPHRTAPRLSSGGRWKKK